MIVLAEGLANKKRLLVVFIVGALMLHGLLGVTNVPHGPTDPAGHLGGGASGAHVEGHPVGLDYAVPLLVTALLGAFLARLTASREGRTWAVGVRPLEARRPPAVWCPLRAPTPPVLRVFRL